MGSGVGLRALRAIGALRVEGFRGSKVKGGFGFRV